MPAGSFGLQSGRVRSRNPVRAGQWDAGHGGSLDRESSEVFRLEMVDVGLAAGPGERRQLHRQRPEVVGDAAASRPDPSGARAPAPVW